MRWNNRVDNSKAGAQLWVPCEVLSLIQLTITNITYTYTIELIFPNLNNLELFLIFLLLIRLVFLNLFLPRGNLGQFQYLAKKHQHTACANHFYHNVSAQLCWESSMDSCIMNSMTQLKAPNFLPNFEKFLKNHQVASFRRSLGEGLEWDGLRRGKGKG